MNLSINIRRPVDEVFAYVSNLQNGPQWQTGLLEVRPVASGRLGVGSEFTSVRKFLGKKIEAVVEIAAYEPNSKMTIKSPSASSPFEEWYLFEPTNEGTRLSTGIELHTSGLTGLAEPLIASSLKRAMESDFDDLKDLLEQRVPAVSS